MTTGRATTTDCPYALRVVAGPSLVARRSLSGQVSCLPSLHAPPCAERDGGADLILQAAGGAVGLGLTVLAAAIVLMLARHV